MKSTIFEPAREIPVAGHFDVIVAGGGFAGISAALSAKRAGANKVLLIEREYTLGGLATLGLVTIYLPLCDGNGRQVSFGIAEELLKLSISRGAEEELLPECWQKDASREERAKKRYRCQYNPAVFASLADQLLISEGIDILFGTTVCAAAMENGHIRALITENKNGRQAYIANSFVDATGDADICRMTGEATIDFKQGNVMAAWCYATKDGELSLRTLGFADRPDSEKPGGKTPEDDTRERFTGRDAAELSRLMVLSRKWAVDAFLAEGDLTPGHSVVTLPTIPQIRMSRRLKGEVATKLFRCTTVVMHRPYIGFNVRVAAGIVHGSGTINHLRHIIQVLHKAGIYARVGGSPCFVQRCPGNQRRVVAVALYQFGPLRDKVAASLFIIYIEAPAGTLAPSEVSQLISPIVVTLFKTLLV